MALEKAPISNLILLNAGLAGRIMAIINNSRKKEQSLEDYQNTESFFEYWESLLKKDPELLSDDCAISDSEKTTASFSFDYRAHLDQIDIPVFFGYGTKDESALLMDELRIQVLRLQKSNFYFKSYFGWEHNFFGLDESGRINYNEYNYDKVAEDFMVWIKEN